jgi:hypothetical protein
MLSSLVEIQGVEVKMRELMPAKWVCEHYGGISLLSLLLLYASLIWLPASPNTLAAIEAWLRLFPSESPGSGVVAVNAQVRIHVGISVLKAGILLEMCGDDNRQEDTYHAATRLGGSGVIIVQDK